MIKLLKANQLSEEYALDGLHLKDDKCDKNRILDFIHSIVCKSSLPPFV